MPTATDITRMRRIITRMRKLGLTVTEVDGWQTRGRPQTFAPRGALEHHDASTIKSGKWGALGVIIAGRPGIPGPLAQFQVARDGTWAIVAAGRANHAGRGGAWHGVPEDSGNRYLYGIEVAGTTGETYTPALHRSLDLGLAVILAETDAPVRMLGGHKEWGPGRKSDPAHSMNWRRQRVAAALNTPQTEEDDDVGFSKWTKEDKAEFIAALKSVVGAAVVDRDVLPGADIKSLGNVLAELRNEVAALRKQVTDLTKQR